MIFWLKNSSPVPIQRTLGTDRKGILSHRKYERKERPKEKIKRTMD